MSELYLACYVVETERETRCEAGVYPNLTFTAERSPYIDQRGNFLDGSNLKNQVLCSETPLAVVQFERAPSANILERHLKTVLQELRYELDPQDMWCDLASKPGYGAVFFFLLVKQGIPGTARGDALAKTYSIDNLNPRFFADNTSSFVTTDELPCSPPRDPRSYPQPQISFRKKIDGDGKATPIQELESSPPSIQERVGNLLLELQNLANEPDNGNDDRRFFRYRKVAPLAICRFIERVRSLPICEGSAPNDRRTPLMRHIQETAEALDLPTAERSDANWITNTDLADLLNSSNPSKARGTLNRERGNGKRIWPNDSDKPAGGGESGWDAHKRFWRKKPGAIHPVFYYRPTTVPDWEEHPNG